MLHYYWAYQDYLQENSEVASYDNDTKKGIRRSINMHEKA